MLKKSALLLLLSISLTMHTWHGPLISLQDLIFINPAISIQMCTTQQDFKFNPLPLTQDHFLHPYQGYFVPTYITTIPNGHVYGINGDIIENNAQVYEFVWQNCFLTSYEFNSLTSKSTHFYDARIAVIAQCGHAYYFHWMMEILGRLALLEINNVEYDYLYVSGYNTYMQEALQLWGIDPSKIIYAHNDYIIQARELIVPSLISQVRTDGAPRLAHYIPPHIVNYIRNKLLHACQPYKPTTKFNDRFFISRQDAYARKIINEDEVFTIFEQHGFSRYQLSTLSFIDQIHLFAQAKIIIGTMGSGFTNVIFCNPNACIIDIMLARKDATISYLCQSLNIEYLPFKTIEFIYEKDGQYDVSIPLETLNPIIHLIHQIQ